MSISMLPLLVCLVAPTPLSAEEKGQVYTSDEIGISLRLPSDQWKLNDMSQGTAKVLVFSASENMSTRCSILLLPSAVLPEGLLSREQQVKTQLGSAYKRVGYGTASLAGQEMDRIEYSFASSTTVEYGLRKGNFWFVFQLAAPDSVWSTESSKRQLEAIAKTLQFTGSAKVALPEIDQSTASEVRERRRQAMKQPRRDFEITHHDIRLTIVPDRHSLKSLDRLTIRAIKEGLDSIALSYSIVSVDSVTDPDHIEFEWRTKEKTQSGMWPREIELSLSKPLSADEEVELVIQTSSDDFFQALDQQLVQEVAVAGQVRSKSSYTSHIAYYPVDGANDAAVDIRLTVPSGYTAVSGGTLVGTESNDSESTFHYRTIIRRPRLLPFGFAVSQFISEAGVSNGGLHLTVYGYPGEETLVRQRLEVAVDSANVFEHMMGPLPWKDVRLAHVTPERKEMGVSLPGLILLSDGFFTDLSKVDLSDGQMNRPDVLSLLIVADELSHQWNFYAAGWPNELAEGISTFTNCLFIEHRHGRDAYEKSIQFCRDAYLSSVSLGKEVAIADPAIYTTSAYRGIAFCKTPLVLDMLRTELGDEKFFAAWQEAFQSHHTDRDGYDTLQNACANIAEKDLKGFFDQWFFRAGYPHIELNHKSSDHGLLVTLRQVQPGKPYRLKSELLVRGSGGESIRRLVELTQAVTEVQIPCNFEVTKVVFDPDERLLKKTVATELEKN